MQTKPIKVLAIVCQLNRGGLENRLLDIIRNMDYKKVCIDVYTYRTEKGLLDDEVIALGGKVYYNLPLTPQNMFWYVKYFSRFLREHPEYKIVHAHQDAWCSVFCKGAYQAGVPVRIAHSRTAISTISVGNIVKNIIKMPTRRYATHYFAVSRLAGAWLFGNRKIETGKVQIWKNAIDCQKIRFNMETRKYMRKILGVEGKKVIIHVGNFTPPKNQLFLLDIVTYLKEQSPNCILLFVGEEREMRLQRKAQGIVNDRGISEYVRFLGKREDVNNLLQAADVFCFPSIFEGLPGAVLEAQAAGLPCIISSTITEEVKVINTTKFLTLDAGVDIWSQELESSFSIKRCDTFEEMIRAGFDIRELTEELTKFYENIGRT